MKKLVSLALVIALLLSVCAMAVEIPEGYPTPVEGIDLNGAIVYLFDYWSASSDIRAEEPTEKQQATYDYRDWIDEAYNCHVIQIQNGSWDSIRKEMLALVENGVNYTFNDGTNDIHPVYCAFAIPHRYFSPVFSAGAAGAYDTTAINVADLTVWSDAYNKFCTIAGKQYGVSRSTIGGSPNLILYFNKALVEAAGIDPETIYDMQANGTWTFAALEEMLAKTTRDTDNDGVIDTYGICGRASNMFEFAPLLNGGVFFAFDENGLLQPTMADDKVINAEEWARKIYLNYWKELPEGANWADYINYFNNGETAFCLDFGYDVKGCAAALGDNLGVVAVPVGAEGLKYYDLVSGSDIWMIPSTMDDDARRAVSAVMDAWLAKTPGYGGDDAYGWLYSYLDERAVEETWMMLTDGEHSISDDVMYLGAESSILYDLLYANDFEHTVAELIEQDMEYWQGKCDTFNESMAKLNAAE